MRESTIGGTLQNPCSRRTSSREMVGSCSPRSSSRRRPGGGLLIGISSTASSRVGGIISASHLNGGLAERDLEVACRRLLRAGLLSPETGPPQLPNRHMATQHQPIPVLPKSSSSPIGVSKVSRYSLGGAHDETQGTSRALLPVRIRLEATPSSSPNLCPLQVSEIRCTQDRDPDLRDRSGHPSTA